MFGIIQLQNLGNIQSVLGAFQRVGALVRLVEREEELSPLDALILPGVGAFGAGMETLRRMGLVEALRRHALTEGKPLFGICLGMQLLLEESEEFGLHAGLGLISGRVRRLPSGLPGHRIPNMGWCRVTRTNPGSKWFSGTPSGEAFYFAHSYYVACADPADIAATIDFGGPITAAIERQNIFGVQFHPEKSQEAGLNLIDSWCRHLHQAD